MSEQLHIVFEDATEDAGTLSFNDELLLRLVENQRVLNETMQSLVNLQEMCAALVADRQAERSVH